ncbi:MAG: hypothetical protein SXU28_08865 [Pseudomonadota bacterium]|nr:hypothetical protein [Pseudomonadota bacterium]
MTLLHALIPLALLQVGPNPGGPNPLGTPEELLNRPERPERNPDPLGLSSPTAAWLAECLTQLETDAARAHSKAQIRRNETSGADRVVANHCLGLAAAELGLWDDARTAFSSAREETPADQSRARGRFAAMAGNAALASGDAAGALMLLRTALTDAEMAASATLQNIATLDMSRALVALGRPEDALAPLDQATLLLPEESEGWLLKATLLRRLDRLEEAQSAIERAVDLAPQDGAIGLEAGVIAVLSGRDDAARQSWQSVIDTQPESAAAETAKGYLDQLGPETETAAQ